MSLLLKRNPLDNPGRWRTGQPSINPESEALEWSGKLPVLRIGDIRLCASSSAAPLGLKAIFGPLFFESVSFPRRCGPGSGVDPGDYLRSIEPFAKFAVEHDILLANVMCHS